MSRLPVQRAQEMDTGSRERMAAEMQKHLGNTMVQALVASAGSAPGGGAANVAQRISASRGAGTPVEPSARKRLESSYGVDLSNVRVHADQEADSLSRAMNATAFTSGRDIFFSPGAYSPSTSDGFRVLAHETAHVVQQSRGPVPGRDVGGGLKISDPADAGEVAAEHAAHEAEAGAPSLSRRHVPEIRPTGSAVQRCGPTPCDCPEEEAARAPPEGTAVQRQLSSPAGHGITVQRAPLPLVPFGDFDLMFNPSATLELVLPSGEKPKPIPKNEATDTFTFKDVPKGSSGQVEVDVAMQWLNKAGPTPKNCEVCDVLRGVTINLPPPFGRQPIVPEKIIQLCKEKFKADPAQVEDILDELTEWVADPCGKFIDEAIPCGDIIILSQGCEVAKTLILKTPCRATLGLGAGIGAEIQSKLLGVIKTLRKALRNLPPECRKGGGGTTPGQPGAVVGSARSILRADFVSNKDGSLTFSGLGPIVSQTPTGAQVVTPVPSLSKGDPTGGSSMQQPTVKTTTGKPDEKTRQFRANIEVVSPKAQPFERILLASPFKINKATFEDACSVEAQIFSWYNRIEPKIRAEVEAGTIPVKIIGRASTTGGDRHNLNLGVERAAEVAKIMSAFTGKRAVLDERSHGEFCAVQGGECPSERRADIRVEGETTDVKSGQTVDFSVECGTGRCEAVEPRLDTAAACATASAQPSRPTLRFGSKGDSVRALQQVLNDVTNAGLEDDGDFGSATHKAVKGFQGGHGLNPDGVVGKMTWQSLMSVPV